MKIGPSEPRIVPAPITKARACLTAPLAPGRGFTTGAPWHPFQDAVDTDGSLLAAYKGWIKLRREHSALRDGNLRVVDGDGAVLVRLMAVGGDLHIAIGANPTAVAAAAQTIRLANGIAETFTIRAGERIAAINA